MDILLLILIALFAMSWFGQRRKPKENQAKKRLMYRRYDGDELTIPSAEPLGVSPGAWRATALEDVPDSGRRRLVVSIIYDRVKLPHRSAERLVWWLAREIQEAAGAHAVLVEAFARDQPERRVGHGSLRVLLAPDGRGWAGENVVGAIDRAGEKSQALTLGELQATLYALS